jgi:integrase
MATTKENAPWDAAGISKATYYRKKKAGEPLKKEETHKKLVADWVSWRESGLTIRPWSNSHKELQLFYIGKYFEQFQYVNVQNLEAWLTSVPTSSFSKRKHMHSTASSFAKYLRHRGLLEGAEHLKIQALSPKRSPYHSPRLRIIDADALNILLQVASKAHHRYQRLLNVTLLVFLSETGLRVSEACNLLRQDLRFSDKPWQANVTVQCGKGGKRRIVPFSKRAQEALVEYLQYAPDGERVFYSFNPLTAYKPIDRHSVARRFQLLSRKTGIDFCPHSLRHYRITQWANDCRIPIAIVQRWAGHSSLEITQKYIHIEDDVALRAAFE